MQPSTSRVSALLTTFNHEHFIAEAIESLLAQTYPLAEIIVVDDGSSDRTVGLASRYSNQGVRVLRGPGKGPSHAMNLAMAEASGDIFLLQSGDDMSMPDRTASQVEALAEADVTATFPLLIDGEGRELADDQFALFFRMHSVADMGRLFKSLYEDGNFICASSVALRRTAWEKVGGFHPGLLQLQDYEYWIRIISAGLYFNISPERLVSYRLHLDNLSSSKNNNRMYRELGHIFRSNEQNIPDEYMCRVLYGDVFLGVDWRAFDSRILSALFYLRHHAESVRQIGVDKLIDILGDAYLSGKLQRDFGVGYREIFQALLYNRG
jgi:glycosyltransferase involved in cell wall biosynthesis